MTIVFINIILFSYCCDNHSTFIHYSFICTLFHSEIKFLIYLLQIQPPFAFLRKNVIYFNLIFTLDQYFFFVQLPNKIYIDEYTKYYFSELTTKALLSLSSLIEHLFHSLHHILIIIRQIIYAPKTTKKKYQIIKQREEEISCRIGEVTHNLH